MKNIYEQIVARNKPIFLENDGPGKGGVIKFDENSKGVSFAKGEFSFHFVIKNNGKLECDMVSPRVNPDSKAEKEAVVAVGNYLEKINQAKKIQAEDNARAGIEDEDDINLK